MSILRKKHSIWNEYPSKFKYAALENNVKVFCFKMPLAFALQIGSVKDNVPTFATATTHNAIKYVTLILVCTIVISVILLDAVCAHTIGVSWCSANWGKDRLVEINFSMCHQWSQTVLVIHKVNVAICIIYISLHTYMLCLISVISPKHGDIRIVCILCMNRHQCGGSVPWWAQEIWGEQEGHGQVPGALPVWQVGLLWQKPESRKSPKRPEGRLGMSDVSLLPGISGQSFDSPFLSPLLFLCLVLLLFLSCNFSANCPFYWLFHRNFSSIFW